MLEKKDAIDLFNGTWDLIDKKDRSKVDDAMMIHKAHSSCYIWSLVGTDLNVARGEWQISRVYSILKMGESALYHAKRSLDICLEKNIEDFDLAFGYEAISRAYKVQGNVERSDEYKELALEACLKIADEGDKKYTLSEIETI